ncbi:MAG: hypothetical protein M3Q65_18315 [Chloroflexota bacterium]|nr:hypothetical protein [Chloroflexota bacterium]
MAAHGTGRSRISRKLRNQLRLFYAIALALLVVVVIRTARGEIPWWWPLPALAAGVALGQVVARVTVLRWDEETGTVVGRTDALGGVILALYLAFVVVKGRLIGAWVHDAHQAAILGLALTAGVMVGRIRATIGGIRSLRLAAGPE